MATVREGVMPSPDESRQTVFGHKIRCFFGFWAVFSTFGVRSWLFDIRNSYVILLYNIGGIIPYIEQ